MQTLPEHNIAFTIDPQQYIIFAVKLSLIYSALSTIVYFICMIGIFTIMTGTF